jgi:hypothetical protein
MPCTIPCPCTALPANDPTFAAPQAEMPMSPYRKIGIIREGKQPADRRVCL